MLEKRLLFVSILTVCSFSAVAEPGWRFKWPKLLPQVQEATYDETKRVTLGEGFKVRLAVGDGTDMSEWVRGKFADWEKTSVRIEKAESGEVRGGEEGYVLTARPDAITIAANTGKGVRLAMMTLRQILQPRRGTLKIAGMETCEFTLADWPELKYRFMDLLDFPEQALPRLERQIRMAAYYKFNYVILEFVGTYRFRCCPWYGFGDIRGVTAEDMRRLVEVARDLGVTLVPAFPSWGHASLAGCGSSKNGVLERSPEYAPLFEPGTDWNWCLTNPEAHKVIDAMVAELYEVFGRPPFFHLCCDEASPPECATCCGTNYSQVVSAHIARMCDKVVRLGARPMIWHDMLLKKGDERWKGFYANGTDETAALVRKLPKDLIVCDWFYGKPTEDGTYPTVEYFRSLGYTTFTCPWVDFGGMKAQCRYALERGLDGVVITTWTAIRGKWGKNLYRFGASGAWSRKALEDDHSFNPSTGSYIALHWRQVGNDTPGGADYLNQGFNREQFFIDNTIYDDGEGNGTDW